jgi:hypothetical protein
LPATIDTELASRKNKTAVAKGYGGFNHT